MDRTRSRKRTKVRNEKREENRVHVTPPLREIRISFWRWISDRGSDGPDVSFRLSKSFQFLESRAFRPDWIISANAAWKRDSKRSRQYDKRQPPPSGVHSWTTPFERSPIPSREEDEEDDSEEGGREGWYSRSTVRIEAGERDGGGGLLGTAVWTGIWDKNNGNLFPFSSGNENVSFLQPGDLFFSSSYWRFTRFDEVKARNSGVRRLEGSRIFLIAREEGGRTFLRFRNAFRYRFLFR